MLWACNSPKTDNQFWTSLNIPKLNCTVQYPKQWHYAVNGKDSIQYSFLAEIVDSSSVFSTRISLWNEKMPFAIQATDYNQGVITILKLSNPGLEVYPLPPDTINQAIYYGYTFNFQDKDSSHFSVYGYTLLRDSLAYNLTMTCETAKARAYSDTLKQFIQSIRFNP